MSLESRRAQRLLETLPALAEAAARLAPDTSPQPPRVANSADASRAALDRRWASLPAAAQAARAGLSATKAPDPTLYARNIENLIGFAQVPVGVAGPLRVRGLHAQGDFHVPLATTEAALVASYNRGAHAATEAGGCTAVLLAEGVTRSPGFVFASASDCGRFAAWLVTQTDAMRAAAATTTRHGRLEDVRLAIEGNHLYLHLDYSTGDAAGQNMVTLATAAVCELLLARTPVAPLRHYVEANMSGDKKASAQSFQSVRGKKVTAEVLLPAETVSRRLRTTATAMTDYWRMSALGGVLSGTLGVQGHYANGLAALFLATGQDVACVAEAAVGVTRMEARENGALYAAVTLPNLIVGTVGGGTGLPTQAAALDLLGLRGPGHARAFAEVAASLCLAGELSIIAALSAGHFASAHGKLARGARAPAVQST
jgi:hydroxymethylglutaryl-CoA reductase (NADPH)